MKVRTWLIVAAFFLLAGGIQTSTFALAREGGFHGGMHEGMRAGGDRDDFGRGFIGGGFRGRGFIGPAFGWGWGDPWFWGPYYYPGPNVVQLHRVNYGTVEFKVKPDTTKVFVDQKFIGAVKDLDHHRAYLPAGNHDIKLTAPDGQVLDRTVYVAAGQKIKIEDKL